MLRSTPVEEPARHLECLVRSARLHVVDRGLKALSYLVAVQAVDPVLGEGLPDIFRQIAGRPSSFFEAPRAHRQIAQELDVNKPPTPGVLDSRPAHVLADREVHVLPVATLVPLRRPRVWQRLSP